MTRIRGKGVFDDVAVRRDPLTRSAASSAERLRQLGVDAVDRIGPSNLGASKIIDVVGKERFAKIDAVRVPGRVAWLNFDLARELGFDVPASGRLTESVERAILDAVAWRLLGDGEPAGDRETLRVYADRYGGTGLGMGVASTGGSGRAAFLPFGNLAIKGIGKTPLSPKNDTDFLHAHGGAPMREGFVEAIWGEVNANLFTEGSTRILAVIDTGDFTEFPDGTRERRALIVRAGSQLRPAHLLEGMEGHKTTGAIFARAAREAGHLVTREVRGEPVMDFNATMSSLIDAHAKTAAEQVRWRILHGAMSSSNMELDGGQIDLATQTSQPYTAPIHILGEGRPFGDEHSDRMAEIERVAKVVYDGFGKAERASYAAKKVNVAHEFSQRYDAHLAVQLAKAAGLKTAVAERVMETAPQAVTAYADVVRELAALTNKDGRFNADKVVHRDKSAVDVFNLLRRFPPVFFDDPSADHAKTIRDLLTPMIDANPNAAATLSRKIDELVAVFGPAYRALMEAARPGYDDADAMVRSVTQRAAFENMPLDRLYKAELQYGLIEQIDSYAWHNDPHVFREVIDKTIASSLRSVDALIGQGTARRLEGGGLEIGKRTIDGIDYAVRAWPEGRRRLHLDFLLSAKDGGFELPSLPGAPVLSAEQVEGLVYRFTTDGWHTTQEVEAKREGDRVTFDIPVLGSDVGQLEGVFFAAQGAYWLKDGASNFRGYSFAVPDRAELARIDDALKPDA